MSERTGSPVEFSFLQQIGVHPDHVPEGVLIWPREDDYQPLQARERYVLPDPHQDEISRLIQGLAKAPLDGARFREVVVWFEDTNGEKTYIALIKNCHGLYRHQGRHEKVDKLTLEDLDLKDARVLKIEVWERRERRGQLDFFEGNVGDDETNTIDIYSSKMAEEMAFTMPDIHLSRKGASIVVSSQQAFDKPVSSFDAFMQMIPEDFQFEVIRHNRVQHVFDHADVLRQHGERRAFWDRTMAEFVAKTWAPERFVDWCLDEDEKRDLAADFI